MASMKIPNKAVAAQLVVFAVIGLIALPFVDYLWRYAHFGVVLAIGFVLSTLGLVGAGDAKYAAVMAPFVAQEDWYPFMFLLGATIIAAFVVHRAVKASALRERFPHWESWTRREFPMGFALAPALILYLLIPLITG
jgi:prepilin peptidase CpaA